jgi:hypothetical protein
MHRTSSTSCGTPVMRQAIRANLDAADLRTAEIRP